MSKLRTLWQGDYPLADAFWTWAVTVGLLVNIVSSLIFVMLITQDRTLLALLVGYGISLPYNFVAIVGVWRSAARYRGPSLHPQLARAATLVLMTVLSFT